MKYSALIVAALAMATSIVSCKKKDDPAPVGKARIQYVNASAQSDTLDIYENDQVVNQRVLFGGITGYRQVDANNRSVTVTRKGSLTKLVTTAVNPPSNSTQTILFNKQAAGSTNLNALILNDTISGGTAGKAMVRFVNLAPSSGTLQLTNNGTIVGNLTYTCAYREFTRYAAVDAGDFLADVRSGSAGTSVMTKTLKLTAGKFYTVVGVGEPAGPSGGTSTLDLVMITNE